VRIHALDVSTARQRSEDLRRRIDSPPPGVMSEVFYHAEPFDVANDLAGKQLNLREFRDKYEWIVNRHDDEASA
jgi:hypothetical protein